MIQQSLWLDRGTEGLEKGVLQQPNYKENMVKSSDLEIIFTKHHGIGVSFGLFFFSRIVWGTLFMSYVNENLHAAG